MTPPARPASDEEFDKPFPLLRLFRTRFAPGFGLFIAVFLLAVGFSGKSVVERIYLELAQRRAQSIAISVAEQTPRAWADFMQGRTLTELADLHEAESLANAFSSEVAKQQLPELKVYDLTRRVLFATVPEEIGTTETGPALDGVIRTLEPGIVTKELDDGTTQYELYVPVFDSGGNLRTVFELYEPVGYLDRLLLSAAVPTLAVPVLFLSLFALALDRLAARAQKDIDMRTARINELRQRLETFVSTTAAGAARRAAGTGTIESSSLVTTLFFSDVRNFTSFAEANSPETVVAFLNDLMSVQVNLLQRYGGDVDKMIGDAVFARFDGPDGPQRAIAAGRAILEDAGIRDLPRTIGIGIFRGGVISGAIGPASRRDYTVIGDSVNVAARLCSEAGKGEIVTAADLADGTFGPTECITVKGRAEPLEIRRYRAA